MTRNLELRAFPARGIELRAEGETVEFRGYATAYEHTYAVGGGPDAGGWLETVAAGAGRRTLNARPDVRLLVNHEGLPLARTRSGTLLLEETEQGLMVVAPALDLRNPRVQELRSAMDRNDVDEMSFAFRVTRQEWNADYTERRIIEYALDVAGSDVSIVTYPANPATVASLRAAANVDELRASARRPAVSLAFAQAIATQIRLGS
jgi:HK97 family phage prohead protease